MENEILVISKYLVEKSQILFSRKKQIMSICTDRLLLQGLNSNLHSDLNLDELDSIMYSDFKDIKVNEKSPTEFTIFADKKYDFSCDFRSRLICEMKHEVSLYLECCDCDLFYCKLLYDIYNPINESTSIQTADIHVYESMIKIKVPVAESYNNMKIMKKLKKVNSKFIFAQALIQKYKKEIFWKHECNMKRDDRISSQLGDTVSQLKAPTYAESEEEPKITKVPIPKESDFVDLEESKESQVQDDEDEYID